MKKKLNIKKLLLILLILAVLIGAAILIILNVGQEEPEKPVEQPEPIIQLPETTYSNMQVTNIQMQYRKDQNKTVLSFDIFNTTDKKVEEQIFETVLIGQDDEIIGRMSYVHIQSLAVGKQHAFEVIYSGDVTATKQIKLIEK